MEFEEWYNKIDFTLIEAMRPEFHREYYCRSAWFKRDDEIASLEQQLAEALSKGMGVSAECSVLEQQLAKYSENLNIERIKVDTLERELVGAIDALEKYIMCKRENKLMREALKAARNELADNEINRLYAENVELRSKLNLAEKVIEEVVLYTPAYLNTVKIEANIYREKYMISNSKVIV